MFLFLCLLVVGRAQVGSNSSDAEFGTSHVSGKRVREEETTGATPQR